MNRFTEVPAMRWNVSVDAPSIKAGFVTLMLSISGGIAATAHVPVEALAKAIAFNDQVASESEFANILVADSVLTKAFNSLDVDKKIGFQATLVCWALLRVRSDPSRNAEASLASFLNQEGCAALTCHWLREPNRWLVTVDGPCDRSAVRKH